MRLRLRPNSSAIFSSGSDLRAISAAFSCERVTRSLPSGVRGSRKSRGSGISSAGGVALPGEGTYVRSSATRGCRGSGAHATSLRTLSLRDCQRLLRTLIYGGHFRVSRFNSHRTTSEPRVCRGSAESECQGESEWEPVKVEHRPHRPRRTRIRRQRQE